MKAVITGCTSGLGRRLAELLISKKYKLRALIRRTSNIAPLRGFPIDYFYGDITKPEDLQRIIEGVDICFHIAAQVSSAGKDKYFKTNVAGTKNLCDAIVKHNPSCRLVYCSTLGTLKMNRLNSWLFSDYNKSKYKAEKLIEEYISKKGLKAVVICPGYIYGPYDYNLIPNIIKILEKGINFMIKGGEENAPLIYIDDLCELFYLAGIDERATGKKYIAVNNIKQGTHEFIKFIADELKYTYPLKIYPRLPFALLAFIFEKIYSIFKIKGNPPVTMRVVNFLSFNMKKHQWGQENELGWARNTPIETGLKTAIQWYINTKESNELV